MSRNAWCRTKVFALVCWVIFAGAPASKAGPLAQFRTPLGDIEVELFDKDKPVTVGNLIKYIESGWYTNAHYIHRWVPGSLIQGGHFRVQDRGTANQYPTNIPSFGTIPFEAAVGKKYSNVYGTIAMARIGADTNSASLDWFINLRDNIQYDTLDGGYTVFGRVVQGTNVLNRFEGAKLGQPYTNKVYLSGEVPVLLDDRNQPVTFDSLVYVDITLLKVAVKRLAGAGHEISWSSVRGATNRVEYTLAFPPAWQTLVATNGNGDRISVTDDSAGHDKAFYRVRIEP